MAVTPVVWRHPDISTRDLDRDSLKIIQRLRRFGYQPYYAGGCVRDILLGHKPNDFDIVSDARPEEVRKVFRNCRVIGRRFRLAHIHFYGKIIEVSTFRAKEHGDGQDDDGYLRNQNTYGTPDEDAHNRDFTINGLFFDPVADEIVDYVGGLRDLHAGLVRTIGEPERRFREDPVRMLRAIKYAGRLDLTIEKDTARALGDCRVDLEKCSRARLLDEILKLVRGPACDEVFLRLLESGILDVLSPTLAGFLAVSSAEEERFWLLLGGLAAVARGRRNDMHHAVLLACLFHPFLSRAWERAALLDGRPNQAMLIRQSAKLLGGFAEKFALPRKLSLTLRQVCSMQHILEQCLRSPKRLARREGFREALRFLELRASVGDVDAEVLKPFKRWLDEPLLPKRRAHQARPAARPRRHSEALRRAAEASRAHHAPVSEDGAPEPEVAAVEEDIATVEEEVAAVAEEVEAVAEEVEAVAEEVEAGEELAAPEEEAVAQEPTRRAEPARRESRSAVDEWFADIL